MFILYALVFVNIFDSRGGILIASACVVFIILVHLQNTAKIM